MTETIYIAKGVTEQSASWLERNGYGAPDFSGRRLHRPFGPGEIL
jgi:hypothetical protein